MLRTVRAFAWMRWRILVNSFDRTEARDRLERLSIVVEQIGPIVAVALLIPSLVGLSALSVYAGYALGGGTAPSFVRDVLRLLAFASTLLAIVGPLVMPMAERTNAVRLLLLPIPRRTLYVAQASSALADPWILLMLPIALFVPVGMAPGGRLAGAAIAFVAGLLFILTLVGLTTLTANVAHLVLRDRRRGELLTLLFVIVMPIMALLPGVVDGRRDRTRPHDEVVTAPAVGHSMTSRVSAAVRRAGVVWPSRQLTTITALAAGGRTGAAGGRTLGLAITAAAIHALGLAAFGALLGTPAVAARRRTRRQASSIGPLPWLSPAASAVALAEVRLTTRTPRGRSVLLSPLMACMVGVFLLMRAGDQATIGPLTLAGGIGLAAFGAFVSLLAILPLAMNQFAIDGAGLTMAFLLPLSDRDLLLGKAVAHGLIAGLTALACIGGVWLIFGHGARDLWLALPPGVLATYLLTAPVAAVVSALLPRKVDLNSISRGSNAHGAAALLGFATTGMAAGVTTAVVLGARSAFGASPLVPLVALAWCVLCAGLSVAAFVPVRSVLLRRRENLGLVVR